MRECVRRGYKLDVNFITQSFGTSRESAEKRLHTLARTNSEWYSREEKLFDDVIIEKYLATLGLIAPKKFNIYEFDNEYEWQQKRDT